MEGNRSFGYSECGGQRDKVRVISVCSGVNPNLSEAGPSGHDSHLPQERLGSVSQTGLLPALCCCQYIGVPGNSTVNLVKKYDGKPEPDPRRRKEEPLAFFAGLSLAAKLSLIFWLSIAVAYLASQ